MLVAALGLAACVPQPPAAEEQTAAAVAGAPATAADAHIPPFARSPYQRFSREAAVQVALREWRAFGQPVVLPHSELPFDNERAEGLWQRVGEYWWLGLPAGWKERGYTGMHDEYGRVFSDKMDGFYAWSAAFIDYVMRMAGARNGFPYSPTHADYINAARLNDPASSHLVITAQRPESYAPQRGDLICLWRGARAVRFDDLPAGHFPGHCDIVVTVARQLLEVVGGNVDNSVALRRIPTTPEGRLAAPDGTPVDPDHAWFVVLQVAYEM